jgi:hypothetical protein
MSVFNIWDQARLTAFTRRSAQGILEAEPRPAPQLSTFVPIQDDKIRLGTMEIRAFGKGRFKAFGATPPIFVPRVRYTESEIELVQIHEMRPVDERLLRKLRLGDDLTRERAGADIALGQQALAIRNERQSDWMVMTALLTGQLPIQFQDEASQGFVVDYGFKANHIVTVTTPWSNLASATPIDDIRAWQQRLADDAGDYGIHIWMNSTTWSYVLFGAQARAILTGTDRGQLIATEDDIKARLWAGDRVQFHVTDAGYLTEGAGYDKGRGAHTKWFADNQVLITTQDPFNGQPIVEQFDGMVAVPVSEFQEPALRQGAQSWIKLDTNELTTYYHQASTRMPRVNLPDNVIAATVS